MDFKHGNMRMGWVYYFETLDQNGDVIQRQRFENIIPDEGRDYILSAAFLSGSQYPTLYFGVFGNDYTPLATDGMVSLLAAASEVVAYSEATRQAFVPDALSGGTIVNTGSPAIITMTSAVTVRGGFLTSNSIKGNSTGLLLSAEKTTSPQVIAAGNTLKIIGGLTFTTS